MIPPALLYLASLLLRVVTAWTRPAMAECPRGWWLNSGVTRSGEFQCVPALLGNENDAPQPPGELHGRIYGCSMPVWSGRRVSCRTRGTS